MFILSDNLLSGIEDYYLLLSKKYPQKTILKLVGDRYKLSRTERSILYRGISIENENISTRDKLIQELPTHSVLVVDGLNQLLTIASYLNGNIVFISTDEILRDASEMHGKAFRTDLLERSIELIDGYCKSRNLKQLLFYIDQQVNGYEKIKILLSKRIPESQIIISDQVDKMLINFTTGIIATSDSQIIDRTSLKVFDLAYHTLKFHFHPNFLDLQSLVCKKP